MSVHARDLASKIADPSPEAEPGSQHETDSQPEPTPVALPGLAVGAADDHVEVAADRRAHQAMRRLAALRPETEAPTARRTAAASSGAIGRAGGVVGPELNNEIGARLGRGEPLAGPVRADMEGAFGQSFSGVRIHTGEHAAQLNRQLSSAAFTLGSDIFFAAGAYRPDDPGGQHLIAHELAHVEQQAGGARRSIRRAVGFEFETGIIAHQLQQGGGTAALPKAFVIKPYSEGFRMETDENSTVGSTIEFVVDPPVAEGKAGRQKLVKIMKRMTEVAEAFRYDPPGTDFVTPTVTIKDVAGAGVKRKDIVVLPSRTLTANPQVTGGIALDKIIDMMGEVGSGDQSQLDAKHVEPAKQLEKMSPDMPKNMAAAVTGAAPPRGLTSASKELQGLGALLVSYLTIGSKANNNLPLNYAKLISNSLLVRTDFGSIFARLPDGERGVFARDPKAFSDWVLGIAGLQPDVAVFERDVRLSNDRNSPNYTQMNTDADLKISRERWLLGITLGIDRLSSYWSQHLSGTLEGLGALGGKFDRVGAETAKKSTARASGVVMEFRNMKRDVPPKDWATLSLGIFDYLSSVNARP